MTTPSGLAACLLLGILVASCAEQPGTQRAAAVASFDWVDTDGDEMVTSSEQLTSGSNDPWNTSGRACPINWVFTGYANPTRPICQLDGPGLVAHLFRADANGDGAITGDEEQLSGMADPGNQNGLACPGGWQFVGYSEERGTVCYLPQLGVVHSFTRADLDGSGHLTAGEADSAADARTGAACPADWEYLGYTAGDGPVCFH